MSDALAMATEPTVATSHRLHALTVRDFRNLAPGELELPAEGVVIVGENGHGKTNLLEAIYYLQLLRSMRGARDVDLIRFGAAGFHLSADVSVGGRRSIAVGFERAGRRKRVRIDGVEPERLSDALGALPSVIFSPADVALIAGAPSERRRYLDVVLALSSRRYLVALQKYRAALVRRNAALRDASRHGSDDSRVAVWEPALAEWGAVLWRERMRWATEVADRFTQLCEAIGERGPATLRYATSLAADADAEVAIAEALEAKRGLDLRRGLTLAGPHREELELMLDGRDLRSFGSAGQQRTAAIALRMLEGATLQASTGGSPLLLLDDPFAELDARRTARVLELLNSAGLGQAVLAVPKMSDIPRELTQLSQYEIRDGRIDTA